MAMESIRRARRVRSSVSGVLTRHYAALLFIILYLIIGLSTLHPLHHWGGDFAQYIFQARAIVENGTLLDTNYIFNGQISPLTYPPGFSILLAPFYAAFGLDLQWLKIPPFVSLGFCLVALYLIFNQIHSRSVALGAISLFALSPYIWTTRQEILSEFLFMLLSFFALYTNSRVSSKDLVKCISLSILTGLLIAGAYMTRQTGWILFIAIVASNIFQIRDKRSLISVAAIVSMFLISYLSFNTGFGGAGHEVSAARFCWNCWSTNFATYYKSLLTVIYSIGYGPSPYRLADFMAVSAVLSVAAGLALCLWKAFRKQSPETHLFLRAIRSISALDLFFGGSLLLLLILPFAVAPRYLLPVIPIVFFYILVTINAVSGSTRRLRWLFPVTVIGALSFYVITDINFHKRANALVLEGAVTSNTRDLYAYVKQNLTAEDLVLVSKPRVFVLYTRRRATIWNKNVSPENILDDVKNRGITHLILGKKWSGLPTKRWMFSHSIIMRNTKVVYEDTYFRMLKFSR